MPLATLTDALERLEQEAAMCGRHEIDSGMLPEQRAALRKIEKRIKELRRQLGDDD